MEPSRVNETLMNNMSIDKRLASMAEKLFTSSLSLEEKEAFIEEISGLRMSLIGVNKGIIKMNVQEEQQIDYLKTIEQQRENVYALQNQLQMALREKETTEEDLPPIL